MGSLLFFLGGWGFLLQAIAIVHFIRRRPDTYWIFVILFLGWVGALIYIVAEVIPDAGLLRTEFQAFPRRRRIRELERAILDNPSAGNYESSACCISTITTTRAPAPVTTRPSRREPIPPTRFTAGALPRWNWRSEEHTSEL